MLISFPDFFKRKIPLLNLRLFAGGIVILLLVAMAVFLFLSGYKANKQILSLQQQLVETKKTLLALQNQDQIKINQDLKKEIENTPINTATLPVNNTPPGSGFSQQLVSAIGSTYVVDVIAADMGSTQINVPAPQINVPSKIDVNVTQPK